MSDRQGTPARGNWTKWDASIFSVIGSEKLIDITHRDVEVESIIAEKCRGCGDAILEPAVRGMLDITCHSHCRKSS